MYSPNLLKILGTEIASAVLKKHSPEQRLFQAIVLQAFEDALSTHGTKEDSYLKKDAHDWFLERNKSFEYVCWNSGFDPEIIHEKYKRLLNDYNNLNDRLGELKNQEKNEIKKQEQFSQKIDELNQETDNLLSEFDKWQT